MAKDISIAISAKDNYSDSINKIIGANRAFTKDADGLKAKLKALSETKYQLKIDTDRADEALKAARKQFRLFGDEASESIYRFGEC